MTDHGGGTNEDGLAYHALSLRLDQSIEDFKVFVSQRFDDQNLRLDERDVRQGRQLDERFKTQTTGLDAAFAAAEKARQEALATTQEATLRTDARIKDLEDRMNTVGGKTVGRADVLGWVVAAVAIVGGLVAFLR